MGFLINIFTERLLKLHDIMQSTNKFQIKFITGNKKKLEEFLSIMTDDLANAYDVTNIKLDLDELQGDPQTIALRKVKTAC